MSSTSLSSPAVGTFTPEAFAAHLAAQPAHAPAWWLERKRAAHAQFVALPMPGPTDEGWRFSSRETLTLAGFARVNDLVLGASAFGAAHGWGA